MLFVNGCLLLQVTNSNEYKIQADSFDNAAIWKKTKQTIMKNTYTDIKEIGNFTLPLDFFLFETQENYQTSHTTVKD